MTNEQKEQIASLRYLGYGYSKIAHSLKMSENTVKSYCQRNAFGRDDINSTAICKLCGKPIVIKEKCKPRQFCCNKCRIAWWKNHNHHSYEKPTYQVVCQHCSSAFESTGNKSRKYCSHECYIAARFGKECGSDE